MGNECLSKGISRSHLLWAVFLNNWVWRVIFSFTLGQEVSAASVYWVLILLSTTYRQQQKAVGGVLPTHPDFATKTKSLLSKRGNFFC